MEKRDPPAFQEYAANMMAKIEYRDMSLAERGLLYTMRLECWVNGRLPANSVRLAKVLGFDAEDIKNALPAVSKFFFELDDFFTSPELDNYKIHLEDSRKKRVDGGRVGGKISAQKRAGIKP